MIFTKTVLILGAGASKPYEFPTGGELVSLVGNEFALPTFLRAEKIMPAEYRPFVDRFRKAQPSSIDEFLEHNPTLADIGRLAIAFHLLPAEYNSCGLLEDLNKLDHWYRYLKAKMGGPLDALADNALRIVTFNYDRSLEHYLYETLRRSYESVDDAKCAKIVERIPVLHVYGSLGSLPWQSASDGIAYGASGPNMTREEVERAGKNIKVLHEGAGDEVQRNFETAQEWLKWADRVLFLGFGFHRDNVQRLAFNKICNVYNSVGKEIAGTCRGLDATSRDGSLSTVRFPSKDADCYAFLHNHVVLT
jgi:hypothetical protein